MDIGDGNLPNATEDEFNNLLKADRHWRWKSTGFVNQSKIHSVVAKLNLVMRTKCIMWVHRRFLSEVANKVKRKDVHPFWNICNWESRTSFVDALNQNVFYRKGGLVALNKHYGVAKSKIESMTVEDKGVPLIGGIAASSDYNLSDGARLLTFRLEEEKELKLIKTPGRFLSGVSLLSSDTRVISKVQKAFLRNQATPGNTYLIVTRGRPFPPAAEETVAIELQKSNNGKQPIIRDEYSVNAVKKGAVKTVKVRYSTLEYNSNLDTSLVKISCSSNTHHFLRVYMAHHLSPILGDSLYGGRVRYVQGSPVLVTNEQSQPPILSRDMTSALHIQQREADYAIPALIHHWEQVLPKFPNKSQKLILRASLPPHFSWTLHQLELMDSEKLKALHQHNFQLIEETKPK